MSRFLTRWISVASVMCAQVALADIPMVTTAFVPNRAIELPDLPTINPPRFAAVRTWVREDVPTPLDVRAQTDLSAFGNACFVGIDVKPLPMAMMAVKIDAPCAPYQSVSVKHDALALSGVLSLTGSVEIVFPALADQGQITVDLMGEQTLLQHKTPDFSHFARVVLSSDDVDPVRLDAGRLAVFQAKGFQVLTVDRRIRSELRVHRLVLERRVTEKNCGRPHEAELRHILPGRTPQIQTLRFAAVDCARVGDIQRLKNIVQDLKLASN